MINSISIKLAVVLFLSLSTNVFSEVVCVDGNCKEVTIGEGSALSGFDDEQKSKIAPTKLMESDKLIDRPSQNTYSQLKLSEISTGMCLIDSKNMNFYKVTAVKKDMVTYVVEAKNHQYSLNVKTVFWKQDSSDAFKHLQKWDCMRTPNLHDSSYVKKCVGSNQDRELLCSPPSRI
jgi:hypothetical protein